MYNPPRWGRPSQATTSASPGVAFGICGARPVSTCKVHDFVLVHVIACLLFFFCFVWPHAMAPTIASDQKKNRRLGLFVFVVSFGARPVSKCKVHDFALVHVIACLLFFLFVSFGHTQWLQPLHRTKKKQATRFVCLCCFFVCSFVYLFDRLFVCVSCSSPLFLFQFLCFLIIDVQINVKILTNILTKIVNFITFCVCAFKTHNFWGVISGSDNDCQCFYTTKTSDFMIFL